MNFPGQAVVNPYDDPTSLMLPGLMVKGPWNKQLAAYVREQGIRALYFNSAKGWQGSDFGFLTSVPEVEEVDIITAEVDNLQTVEELRQLRRLLARARQGDSDERR